MALVYPILGIPIVFHSQNLKVNRLIEKSFSGWLNLNAADIEDRRPMDVHIEVVKTENVLNSGASWQYNVSHRRLSGKTAGIHIEADRIYGYGKGIIAPSTLGNENLLRRKVLECLALFLATGWDRTPLHASAIIKRDKLLLFIGRSGAGKSTLAYAACRTGCGLLAEDAIYLSTADGLKVWGNPGSFYLRPDTKNLFPELADYAVEKMPNEKDKLVIDANSILTKKQIARSFQGGMVLCFLQKEGNGLGMLHTLSSEMVAERLRKDIESGFDLDPTFSSKAVMLSHQPNVLFEIEPGILSNKKRLDDLLIKLVEMGDKKD